MPKFKFKQKVMIVYQDEPISRRAFKSLTSHPLCASIDQYRFPVEVVKVKSGGHTLPIKFECLSLQHTDPCLGYRIYVEGKVVTYCSDTAPCKNDIRLAQNADLLLHECAMSLGKSDFKWGHSNPEEAARVAKEAGVKRLVLTHFGANSYFSMEKRRTAAKAAKDIFPSTVMAKDGLVIKV